MLAVNLDTGLVSQYQPSLGLDPSQLILLQLPSFQPPPATADAADTAPPLYDARVSSSKPPDIRVEGVGAALPFSSSYPPLNGSTGRRANTISFRVVGADVAAGDSIVLAAHGNCSSVVAGGGPLTVASAGAANLSMQLVFDQPVAAQMCYRRATARDLLYQALPWQAAPLQLALELTVVSFLMCSSAGANPACPAVPLDPWQGPSLSLLVRGPLADGDAIMLVAYDTLISKASLCNMSRPIAAKQVYGLEDASRSTPAPPPPPWPTGMAPLTCLVVWSLPA